MKLFYSIRQLSEIIGEHIYHVSAALKRAGVEMSHDGKPADLSRWTGGAISRGNNLYIKQGYYDYPDPSNVLVLTDSLPSSWIRKIKLNDAESGNALAEEECTESEHGERSRTDGLKLAMIAGKISYESKHRATPTARALFDWIASNDETGNVEDFNLDTDTITWKRADGGFSDTTFKSFQGRFTNLKK